MKDIVFYVASGSELHCSAHLLKLLEDGAFATPKDAYDNFSNLEGEPPAFVYALGVVKRLEPKITFE